MALEIERKFLLYLFPDEEIANGSLQIVSEQRIEQTYLAIDTQQELRVRKMMNLRNEDVQYTHTFKKGTGIIREEIEYEISSGLYEKLIHQLKLKPLIKNRTTVTYKETGMIMEMDRYDLLPLIIVEVEFSNIEDAREFKPLDWFGPDVSTEKQYSNKEIWKNMQG